MEPRHRQAVATIRETLEARGSSPPDGRGSSPPDPDLLSPLSGLLRPFTDLAEGLIGGLLGTGDDEERALETLRDHAESLDELVADDPNARAAVDLLRSDGLL